MGSSPDECHSKLLTAISPILRSITPKGADFFGISHPTIQNLIQSSPGTRKLTTYKQQRFEVCIQYIPTENVLIILNHNNLKNHGSVSRLLSCNYILQVSKNQMIDQATSPITEVETDPGLGFAALHRHYALNSYRAKEEPSDHDLLALQDLLS